MVRRNVDQGEAFASIDQVVNQVAEHRQNSDVIRLDYRNAYQSAMAHIEAGAGTDVLNQEQVLNMVTEYARTIFEQTNNPWANRLTDYFDNPTERFQEAFRLMDIANGTDSQKKYDPAQNPSLLGLASKLLQSAENGQLTRAGMIHALDEQRGGVVNRFYVQEGQTIASHVGENKLFVPDYFAEKFGDSTIKPGFFQFGGGPTGGLDKYGSLLLQFEEYRRTGDRRLARDLAESGVEVNPRYADLREQHDRAYQASLN